MKIKLPDSVASQQDLNAILQEIHNYARWFTHESIKKRIDIRHSSAPPLLSPGTAQIIHEWSAKQSLTTQRLDELIENIESFNKKALAVTITLAAPPTNDIKSTLVGWCRANINTDILVTFKFNSTILGGMVISFGSHVFDWSFRRQILASRNKFTEVLRRV